MMGILENREFCWSSIALEMNCTVAFAASPSVLHVADADIPVSTFNNLRTDILNIRNMRSNSNRDFYSDVYTNFNRIKLTIWAICAFRVLKPHQRS